MEKNKRLYSIYHNMKSRCYLPTFPRYKYYGDRNIKICEEWLGERGFANFNRWAIKHGYTEELMLDRINNDKSYSPDNCRWVTALEQNNNTRKNHYVSFMGITKSVADWARIFDIDRCVLNNRLRRGWGFWKAVSTHVRAYDNH